jgi:hypothetical protein
MLLNSSEHETELSFTHIGNLLFTLLLNFLRNTVKCYGEHGIRTLQYTRKLKTFFLQIKSKEKASVLKVMSFLVVFSFSGK